jgi:23S rRNA (guanosine2251-2'-O)-methyltransferase
MKPNSPNLYVMIEKIRSAFNVGSVFRISDSAAVDKLFLCGWTAIPPHPKVAKTALGSMNSVAWEHHCDALQLAKLLKTQQVKLVGLETTQDARSIYHTTFAQDTCLIFGHEEEGISAPLLSLCDEVVKIPHFGIKESLNISVAAGIAIYEYRRKQLKQDSKF